MGTSSVFSRFTEVKKVYELYLSSKSIYFSKIDFMAAHSFSILDFLQGFYAIIF